MTRSEAGPVTIDELLTDHTPEVADLARRLVDHLTAAAQWTGITVYPGWHGVGFRHAVAGYVVGVFPKAESVRVLFEQGRLLGAAPFVEGDGQTRHIDFTHWDFGRIAAVDDLLDRALAG